MQRINIFATLRFKGGEKMIKKLATIGAAAALLAVSAMPALAAHLPPGPPHLAVNDCPGRSVNNPGSGPQATAPNLDNMADGLCPTPPNQP